MSNFQLTGKRSRRSIFLKWLRRTHGWIGLWGAVMGLLFGGTGILLNHRSVMKIPAAQSQETSLQLPLPDPAPRDAQAMADWLQQELTLEKPAARVRNEPSKPVAWGDKALKQPARWTASFTSSRASVQTEYWVGNGFVSVKRKDHNLFATLNNLHQGTSGDIGWILLVDTLAGSIILLSITGVLLWMLLHRRRMIGVGIILTAVVAAGLLAMQTM